MEPTASLFLKADVFSTLVWSVWGTSSYALASEAKDSGWTQQQSRGCWTVGNFFVALFTCREKYRQTGSLDHRGTQVVRGDSVHWTQKAPIHGGLCLMLCRFLVPPVLDLSERGCFDDLDFTGKK